MLSNFHENDPVIAALVFLSFCEALGVSEDSSWCVSFCPEVLAKGPKQFSSIDPITVDKLYKYLSTAILGNSSKTTAGFSLTNTLAVKRLSCLNWHPITESGINEEIVWKQIEPICFQEEWWGKCVWLYGCSYVYLYLIKPPPFTPCKLVCENISKRLLTAHTSYYSAPQALISLHFCLRFFHFRHFRRTAYLFLVL